MGRTLREFSGPSFTDQRLKAIRDLDQVEILELVETAVTDEGFSALLRARSLVEISLLSDQLTDDALEVLAQLPALRSLQIH